MQMLNVLILGAGGHATVVADILMRARDAGEQINPIGYLDDNSEAQNHNLLGLPVLGKITRISSKVKASNILSVSAMVFTPISEPISS